jgi:YjbE family integral membrane protein
MDLLSPQFFSALFAIIVIDLVLAGDNAIVIALAARKLPTQLRNKAIVWGTVGAIVVRAAMSLAVVALLKIPGLQGAGALLLVWIAYRLLAPHDDSNAKGAARTQVSGFWAAIRTIVVADAVMGLDNVLGVAGAAQGSFLLVILGLLISVPIMVWGSSLILRIVDRYPVVVYLGAGVLAWTAAVMLINEPLAEDWIDARPWLPWVVYLLLIGGVLLVGWLRNRARGERGARSDSASGV